MKSNCPQVVVENYFEPCILYLLLKKRSYGYEIQKELKTKCTCAVNIGNLYRCLGRLEKSGHIKKTAEESAIGPKRFFYAITPKGKVLLASWIQSLEEQSKIIRQLIVHYKKIQ